MRTLEVLDKYVKGRKLRSESVYHYSRAFLSLSGYSADWPELGVVVNEWLTSIKGMSDVSVYGYYRVVKAVARYMTRHYKLPAIADDIECPRVEHHKRRYFTPAELKRVVAACVTDMDRAIILTLMDSLMRIGELCSIDKSGIGDGFVRVNGKTGERVYRLDRRLCRELVAMAGDGEPVFKGADGERLSVSALKARVHRVVLRAGITGKKLGPHTLRHSGASLVALKTGSQLMVKALLQHDNINTSSEYLHDVEESLQQEISPLALALGEEDTDKRLALPSPGEGSDGGEVVEGEVVDKSFVVEVPDGAECRPLLRCDDLRLFRKGLVVLINSGLCVDGEEEAARELMRRILRKQKVGG